MLVEGQKLSDGKGVQGKGRLTQERIDSFQVFYGKALRNNKGDSAAMGRATMAILKHYSDIPTDQQHEDCPEGTSSWCKFQADKARNDGIPTFIPVKNPISQALYDVLLPTFIALSDKRLLVACEQGKDQNANESLHHVIWNLVPKEQHHSPQEVSLGINLAVMLFNIGQESTMRRVLTAGDQLYPTSSVNIWCNIDDNRIHQSQRQATDSCKITRKNKRAEKVKQLDAFKNQEGEMYKSGHFHITSTSSKARRAPVCKVCQQPRKGHSRGPCSQQIHVPSPTAAASSSPTNTPEPFLPPTVISSAALSPSDTVT